MCAYMCAVVTEDRDRQQATGKERDKENLKQNFKKFVILLKITRDEKHVMWRAQGMTWG